MSHCSQRSASIQPRTSSLKFDDLARRKVRYRTFQLRSPTQQGAGWKNGRERRTESINDESINNFVMKCAMKAAEKKKLSIAGPGPGPRQGRGRRSATWRRRAGAPPRRKAPTLRKVSTEDMTRAYIFEDRLSEFV